MTLWIILLAAAAIIALVLWAAVRYLYTFAMARQPELDTDWWTADPADLPDVNHQYGPEQFHEYMCPGMNRVFQAAGRVIRREEDKGVIVLIDDRFDDPIYKKSLPALWKDVKFIGDPKRLREILDEFWKSE